MKKIFTLIELFIVISVIAILAGMLLPALQKAKASVLQVNCASNLSNIIKAFHYYIQDHHDYMPPYRDYGTPENWWNNTGKTGLLFPYLHNTAVIGRSIDGNGRAGKLYCPAESELAARQSTYGYNSFLYQNLQDNKFSQFKRPSVCVVTGDSGIGKAILSARFSATIYGGAFGIPHNRKGVFAFADGHVATLEYRKIPNIDVNYRAPYYAFWCPFPVPEYENWYNIEF